MLLAFVLWNVYQRATSGRLRSTDDLATIRQALDDYEAEHGAYPAARSIEELRQRLLRKDGSPMPIRSRWGYAAKLPMRDPWRNAWVIDVTPVHYSIRTLGADGKPDPDPPRGALLDTESSDRDTIIVDGRALQHPWSYGGGGDERGGGSIVSLGHGPDNGKIIVDDYWVDVLRDGHVIASLLEAPSRFEAAAGEYQIRLRGGGRVDAVAIERGKVRHIAVATPAPEPETPERPREGVNIQVDPRASKRYAYPRFAIDGGGVHKEGETDWSGFPRFGVPAGKYEVSSILSGQVVKTGTFETLPRAWITRDVAVTWGDVHVSVAGPVEIEEAVVAGWEAVVRDDTKMLARIERFPGVFFLLPGTYVIELLHEGRVRDSRKVTVAVKSEQWFALKE